MLFYSVQKESEMKKVQINIDVFSACLDVYFVLMGNEHSSEHNAEDFMRNNVAIKLPLAKAGAPMPDKEELDQVIPRDPWNPLAL